MFFVIVLLAFLYFCTGAFGYVLLVITMLVLICMILPGFFWVILTTSVFGAILYYFATKDERRKNAERKRLKEQREEEGKLYKAQLADFIKKYGNCSVDINLGGWTDHTLTKRLLVFEESKIIIINESKYKFSDILGFSMIDDSTKETTTFSDGGSNTSTGSMIGRAIVGGVVGGGLGAVAGATTAKRNDSSTSFSEAKTKHRYTIYINLNSFENPTLKLSVIEGSDRAYKIANILNVIIERNKQN